MIKTGLFFGSFNPIHIGHLILAEYMVEHTDLAELWFIPSPHNPLKEKKSLLADHHRLALVNQAIDYDDRFKVVDLEFKMPQPSYTIDTLIRLSEKYPNHDFILICGADIFKSFHKWKNYKELLKQYSFYVYNRPGSKLGDYSDHPKIKLFEAPLIEISSSFIRKSIQENKNVNYMLPDKVWKYIEEMHFYKK